MGDEGRDPGDGSPKKPRNDLGPLPRLWPGAEPAAPDRPEADQPGKGQQSRFRREGNDHRRNQDPRKHGRHQDQHVPRVEILAIEPQCGKIRHDQHGQHKCRGLHGVHENRQERNRQDARQSRLQCSDRIPAPRLRRLHEKGDNRS